MDIGLRSLECFRKVAEMEHMTVAARELYISQSQLSRIIAELEDTLGAKLFDREGKGIKLNACGREFYRYAQQIASLCSAAQNSVREVYLHEASQLTVTANITAYMPSLLRDLKRVTPSVNYRQTTATREQLISQLKEGRADFAICAPAVSDIELECIHLRDEKAGVIYYDGHWLENRKSASAEELLDEDIICVTKGFALRDLIDETCRRYNWHLKYVVETFEPTQMGAYVKAGLGISLLPMPVVERNDWFKDRYVRLDDSPVLNLCLVWKKDRVFSEVDREFYNTVLGYFDALNREYAYLDDGART